MSYMDFYLQEDSDKLSDIVNRMNRENNNEYVGSEYNAVDILNVADSLRRTAIDMLVDLIVYQHKVLKSSGYDKLFSYYDGSEEWNISVIEELYTQEKYGRLPKLNYLYENNTDFLNAMLIKALEAGIDDCLDNRTIEESIGLANHYFDIIRENSTDVYKDSCERKIQEIKEKLADEYADKITNDKLLEYDNFEEEHYNSYYINQCDLVLDFEPNSESAKNLKIYFLEQKIEDMKNDLDEE